VQGIPPDKVLPFGAVGKPLDEALEALKNKIDREWPKRLDAIPGAQALFLTIIKIVINTYQSVRFLTADIPKKDAPPPEFALSIPPLARSMLDQLFAVVLLSEDLPTRTQWFYKAGWREINETVERYSARYKDDPTWEEWLEAQRGFLESIRIHWAITDDEIASLKRKREKQKRIRRWPLPGKMKDWALRSENRAFFEYLDAWFYKSLSQDAHLSFPGLARRGAALLPKPGEERTAHLERRKSQAVFTTTTIVLALASEMEHLLRFGLAERLAYVWGVLDEYWGEAKDLYTVRYERFLKTESEAGAEGPLGPLPDGILE